MFKSMFLSSTMAIWDISNMGKAVRGGLDPILAYTAGAEIEQLQWSSSQPDWVAIAFSNRLQILRMVNSGQNAALVKNCFTDSKGYFVDEDGFDYMKASEDAEKLVNQERSFACAEIESARAVVQRIGEALNEQEKNLQTSGNQN